MNLENSTGEIISQRNGNLTGFEKQILLKCYSAMLLQNKFKFQNPSKNNIVLLNRIFQRQFFKNFTNLDKEKLIVLYLNYSSELKWP